MNLFIIRPPYWNIDIGSGCAISSNQTDKCSLAVAFCKPIEASETKCTGASGCLRYPNSPNTIIVAEYTIDPFVSDRNKMMFFIHKIILFKQFKKIIFSKRRLWGVLWCRWYCFQYILKQNMSCFTGYWISLWLNCNLDTTRRKGSRNWAHSNCILWRYKYFMWTQNGVALCWRLFTSFRNECRNNCKPN